VKREEPVGGVAGDEGVGASSESEVTADVVET